MSIMKATPVKGTRDYLPKETEIRDYLQNIIMETYSSAGFQRITTPIIEDSVNLDKSEGGENLNLIFKILKRGKKLDSALAGEHPTEKELADMGLRYDLTLPLSRYYANNRNELLSPFKVIQMDRVYRAERPQKGRLREFMQCDIDIIGNESRDAEIELILTTTKALNRVGLSDYKVKINDRRILSDIFAYAGFATEDNEKLAIIFDKQDKIGIDGVKAELEENGFDQTCIDKFIALFADGTLTLDSVANVCDASYVTELQRIIDAVTTVSKGTIPVEFCPSLVRGQGYYTGTIFEVEAAGYSGAVAGGGRYDNLIGKFLNEEGKEYQKGAVPGSAKLEDKDGNGSITADDKKIIGSKLPSFLLSMGNRFDYKNIYFSFLLNGVFGQTKELHDYNFDRWMPTYNYISGMDYWTPENPTNEMTSPAYVPYDKHSFYKKMNYVNIKNITIGYTFPKTTLSAIGISSLSINASVNNLYTFSNIDNWLNLEDSDANRNVLVTYPTARSYMFGLNLTF